MKEIRVEEAQKLSEILEILKNEEASEIEITNPQAPIFQIGLNKAVLVAALESFGKKLRFKENGISQSTAAAPKPQENLGFVEGQDVAQTPKVETSDQTPEHALEIPKKKRNFLKILKFKGSKWIYALGFLLLILIGGGIALLNLLPSASVELKTASQLKESQLSVVASATATSIDQDTSTIPLKKVEVTQEDSLEQATTGTKETGTPAKGRVSIVNKDTAEKNFFAGETITTVDGAKMQFTLDESVAIEGSPAGCGATPLPACKEAGVNVTAKGIGEAGNVPSGTVFQVGSADLLKVSAVSLTNFTGGTSKKIKIVTADDQKKAEEDLLIKMSEKATTELKDKNPEMVIPEGSIENQIVKKTYSKQVNEEAENFKLTMQVQFIASGVLEEDLKKILESSVLKEASEEFKIEDKNTTVSGEVLEKTPNEMKLLGKIKTSLTPDLNENEIRENLAGKKFSEVDGYLKSLNSVSGFEIKIEPAIFTFLQALPSSKNKIQIKIIQE